MFFVMAYIKKPMKKIMLFLGVVLLMGLSHAQVWNNRYKLTGNKQFFKGELPHRYRFYGLDRQYLASLLENVPVYGEGVSTTFVDFPYNIHGDSEPFEMYRYRVMEAELQNKYPEIKTYIGKSKNNRTVYLLVSPYQTSAVILQPSGSTFHLDPYNETTWIGYHLSDESMDDPFYCAVENDNEARGIVSSPMPPLPQSDGILREYRMAVYATGYYSLYHLHRLGIPDSAPETTKKAAILSEVTRGLQRLNSVFERELSVHFNLVANNDQLIFVDTLTEPYKHPGTSETKHVIDSIIGFSNYDIGQSWDTLSRGYFGLTGLGNVCTGIKGSCICMGDAVERDRFYVKVVAHETGHMFGAWHVFSYNCGDITNRVEAGAGSTIMSYVGGCGGSRNYYKKTVDDRFNFRSIKEIYNAVLSNSSHDCSVQTVISNNPPVETDYPDKYIPKLTPFLLPANGTDSDGDVLSYVWDEEDTAPYILDTISSTSPVGPLFRAYNPRHFPLRFFPNVDSLVLANQLYTTWEKLPAVDRDLHFNITLRDNHPGMGQFANDEVTLHVDTTAGPFSLTCLTTDETWIPGETKTITWNVANTDNPRVNCQYVDIYLSLDGGYHLTNLLEDNVPNTGSYTITVPNVSSPRAKLYVKAANNYFFAVSGGNIRIGSFTTVCGLDYSSSPGVTIPDDNLFGITDTIEVPDNFIIEDLNVSVDITHPDASHLIIWLYSPQDIPSMMYRGNCHNPDLVVTFDEEAPAGSHCSPGDRMISQNNYHDRLTKFYQHPSAGKWVLKIRDTIPGETGTLNAWTLSFCSNGEIVRIGKNTLENVQVFPNPGNGEFSIRFPLNGLHEKVKFKVFDLTGRLILHESFMPGNENYFERRLHIPDAKEGVYILKVAQGNRYFTTKLQIKK